MAKLTINPEDVVDLKTPLYKKDDNSGIIHRLLPETTADQVALLSGENVEAKVGSLETNINAVSSTAADAISIATEAQAAASDADEKAENAINSANNAKSIANTAKSVAESVDAQINNEATGLAATKAIADDAKEIAEQAKDVGQIGELAYVGEVDANTLIEAGNYSTISSATNGYANHFPVVSTNPIRVYVKENEDFVYQEAKLAWGNFSRHMTKANSEWSNWLPSFLSLSNLSIYISKNGNDANTGFSSSYPVKTFNRALEIANSVTFSNSNASIIFRVGAGNWGNITLEGLPYSAHIVPYDGSSPTEYSEELPVFGVIVIWNSPFVRIRGIVADQLQVRAARCLVQAGYKCINYVQGSEGGVVLFEGSANPATNIWEISSGGVANDVIQLYTFGSFSLDGCTVRLADNLTKNQFLTMDASAHYYTSNAGNVIFNPNGHTFTGKKCLLRSGSHFTSKGGFTNGVPIGLDNLFGSGWNIESGVILNGVSTGNVNKSGDTMTGPLIVERTGENLQFFIIRRPDIEKGVNPSGTKTSYIAVKDKNDAYLMYIRHYVLSDGQCRLEMQLTKSDGVVAGFTMGIGSNNATWTSIPNPKASSNTNEIATTSWTNSKLGTGASLTALVNIDETSEDYIETLEIKKQKAIAQINADIAQAIYAGFPYEIDGVEYLIGYSLFDQNNLNGDAVLAAQNPGKVMSFRCMDETGNTVWLDVPTETVLDIQKYGIVSHRDMIRKEADEKKALVMAAENDEQLQAIMAE